MSRLLQRLFAEMDACRRADAAREGVVLRDSQGNERTAQDAFLMTQGLHPTHWQDRIWNPQPKR